MRSKKLSSFRRLIRSYLGKNPTTSLFSRLILSRLGKKKIIVFGDSHSAVFSNIADMDVVHVGPATAHNLSKADSTTQAREQILARLKFCPPEETAVLLVFGEIDCRMHILKAASTIKVSIQQAVEATVARYCGVLKSIVEMGYTLLVYGPAGSGSGWNSNFPSVGREQDRNYAIHTFNVLLEQNCRQLGVAFVSIDDLVINKDSWLTRAGFLNDGCHLNNYPKTVVELQTIILSRYLTWLEAENSDRCVSPCGTDPTRVDHADGKPFVLTSAWHDYPLAGIVCKRSPYFFHTDERINGGIRIDFLAAFVVDQIIIHNRTDGLQERANHLYLVLGLDQNTAVTVPIATGNDFLNGNVSSISQTFPPVLARFASLYSSANTYLHLAGIEIIGTYPSLTSNIDESHEDDLQMRSKK
jgi:hypothetical protein